MTARPRKISQKQLREVQENSRRNWNNAARKLGSQSATPAPRRRRRRTS